MRDFLESLSELSSWRRLPGRWCVSFALGLVGMIAILMHVESASAVPSVFLDLVAGVVIGAAWQRWADRRARRRRGDRWNGFRVVENESR